MYLAYVDESGDPGPTGSFSFALACILVPEEGWLGVLDELLAFRRFLRDRFGIPVRAELKAHTLIRGNGPLATLGLSDSVRRRIFRLHLGIQDGLQIRTLAVVIDKAAHYSLPDPSSPEHRAWEYLLQRLERQSHYTKQQMMILHDHGNDALIRALARKRRRYAVVSKRFGPGTFARPFRRLLDDPVPRDSQQSYFLQLADFAAYAAFRKIYPPQGISILTRIASQDCWDLIGAARHAVSSPRRDGIVLWP
jgi:hypothetical protein